MNPFNPRMLAVHIPDAWKLDGYEPSPVNRFEFEAHYTNGFRRFSERELLRRRIACYWQVIDRFRVIEHYV